MNSPPEADDLIVAYAFACVFIGLGAVVVYVIREARRRGGRRR